MISPLYNYTGLNRNVFVAMLQNFYCVYNSHTCLCKKYNQIHLLIQQQQPTNNLQLNTTYTPVWTRKTQLALEIPTRNKKGVTCTGNSYKEQAIQFIQEQLVHLQYNTIYFRTSMNNTDLYTKHDMQNYKIFMASSNQIKWNLYYTSTGYIYNTTILHNHIQKAPIKL